MFSIRRGFQLRTRKAALHSNRYFPEFLFLFCNNPGMARDRFPANTNSGASRRRPALPHALLVAHGLDPFFRELSSVAWNGRDGGGTAEVLIFTSVTVSSSFFK